MLDIIILVRCLAFFSHSIQLERDLAPGTAFALKMATLKLHLSPGQPLNSQLFLQG